MNLRQVGKYQLSTSWYNAQSQSGALINDNPQKSTTASSQHLSTILIGTTYNESVPIPDNNKNAIHIANIAQKRRFLKNDQRF